MVRLRVCEEVGLCKNAWHNLEGQAQTQVKEILKMIARSVVFSSFVNRPGEPNG